MSNDSKVFVTQVPSRLENGEWVPTVDITPARHYGSIEVMLPAGFFYTDESSLNRLRSALEDFQNGDFLLPMGDPVLMVAAAAILGARRRPFKVLKWDRKTSEYYEYVV